VAIQVPGDVVKRRVGALSRYIRWGFVGKILTAGELVETILKLVILLPEHVDIRNRNTDSSLVCFPQLVHLLLVLPLTASNRTGSSPEELYIIRPNPPRVFVEANSPNYKLIGLSDRLASCSTAVIRQIVASSDIVEIFGPQLDVGRGEEALAEEALDGCEVAKV
jgi:hypothetical protein